MTLTIFILHKYKLIKLGNYWWCRFMLFSSFRTHWYIQLKQNCFSETILEREWYVLVDKCACWACNNKFYYYFFCGFCQMKHRTYICLWFIETRRPQLWYYSLVCLFFFCTLYCCVDANKTMPLRSTHRWTWMQMRAVG